MIARVFPRRTKATPTDALAFTDEPGLFPPDVEEVHVSCAFTWDKPRAEYLARAWELAGFRVELGGPAYGTRGEDFEPGVYLRHGYTITSRGCPNRCWFCSVWKRDGDIRELPIRDGWNVLDDNLLACSESHIRAVFAMLKRQTHPVELTGGLEAARLRPWHVDLLSDLRPKQMFFAYDTPDDYEPLVEAGRMLLDAGFTVSGRAMRAYVLIGYPRDTTTAAERRLYQTVEAGFWPCAMLWRGDNGEPCTEWCRFQRLWARPAIIASRLAQYRTVSHSSSTARPGGALINQKGAGGAMRRRYKLSYTLWLPWGYGWEGRRVVRDSEEHDCMRHFRTASKAWSRFWQADVPKGTVLRRGASGRVRTKEWEKP